MPLMTMTTARPLFDHIIAFEVSKDRLVVHTLPADEQRTIPNTRRAVRHLLRAEAGRNCRAKLGPLLVVCEATGGYERHVLEAAYELDLACHRAHGSRVRSFAKDLASPPRPIQSAPEYSPSTASGRKASGSTSPLRPRRGRSEPSRPGATRSNRC
jgi:hypothetical protein